MVSLFSIAIVGILAIAPSSAPAASMQTTADASAKVAAPSLPADPRGTVTVMGGIIRNVDPVSDELTLRVFGGKPLTIYFDPRTEVYRDGKRVPLSDLHPNDRAAVETALDGTTVFAESIHMLSKAPEGNTQGQVVSYDPSRGSLTIDDALSRQPITLHLPEGTPIHFEGQEAAAGAAPALEKGDLVSVEFASNNSGRGVVRQVSILATPGATFSFSGVVSFFDLHAGTLMVTDPRDNQSYQISFEAARFPAARQLHNGAHVVVKAQFDGNHYVATSIQAF